MSTYYVAGREVHLKGGVFTAGWQESPSGEPGTAYLFAADGHSGYAAKGNARWIAHAVSSGGTPRYCDTVGEAMTYVEALVALQE